MKAKAAVTRHLAAFALHFINTYGQFESVDDFTKNHDLLARGALQLLCEFYTLLKENSQFFCADAKERIPKLGNQLAAIYAKLSRAAYNANQRLYKTTPKFHLFIHLCVDQIPKAGNARFFWTYSDEDLVGQLIKLSRGLHPSTLCISLLCKWLLLVFDEMLLDVDLSDDEEEA